MTLVVQDNSTKTDKFLYIIKTVRNPLTKKNTKKMVKNLGKLSELKLIYDDPIAHFKEVAKNMTDEAITNIASETINIDFASNATPDFISKKVNFGCLYLSYIYHTLKIDKVFNNFKARHGKNLPPINKIFMFLTYLRTLSPTLSFDMKDNFAEIFNFNLQDVYLSLDTFHLLKNEIIKSIYSNIEKLVKLDTSICHYDLTNFFVYTSNYELIKMALITDKNGIPINYKLFSSNVNNSLTLDSFVKEQNIEHSINKAIVVTDDINNIDTLKNINGYILKKSMFKLSENEREMFLNIVKPNIEKAMRLKPDSYNLFYSIEVYDKSGDENILNGAKKYIFMYSKTNNNLELNYSNIENAKDILNAKLAYTKKKKGFCKCQNLCSRCRQQEY